MTDKAKKQYYWNDAAGCATTEKTGIPLYKSNHNVCVESWWIDKGARVCLDFAYNKDTPNQLVDYERSQRLAGCDGAEMRHLTLPADLYEKLINKAQ